MVKYDEFHYYMCKIRKAIRISDEMADEYPDDWTRMIDSCNIDLIVEMLETMMNDKDEWIKYHIYECNSNFADKNSVYQDVDLCEHRIDSDKDLYFLITGIKECYVNSDCED